MKKRFIFDLDGTLLHGDYISERDYFRSVLNKEDAEKFLLLYFEKLCEYESLHQKYDYSSLSKFLSEKTGVNITSEIVEGWIKVNSKMDDKLLEETGVVTTPGSGFGPSGEGYVRFTAFSTKENTIKAMEKIKAIL
mgnify:FL=1